MVVDIHLYADNKNSVGFVEILLILPPNIYNHRQHARGYRFRPLPAMQFTLAIADVEGQFSFQET